MFVRLLFLFTMVPMVELVLLIKLGGYVGFLPTVGLVALTGVVGVSLARSQGFLVINRINNSLSAGKLPANTLIEGLLILIGGVMLLTPGLLTDITGFSLVIPTTRGKIRELVRQKLKEQIDKGNLEFSFFGHSSSSNHSKENKSTVDDEDKWDDLSQSIDVDYQEVDDQEDSKR
ncbi:MAG: FxsA family protein [Bacillota bacterium]